MKILITGNNGFVGNNLISNLNKHHEIYGLDIVPHVADGVVQTFNWNELNQILEIDVIIHLAGKAHDTKNLSASEEYYAINTDLTKKIFDFFLKSAAQKFIYFSSVKAVADKVEGILTEDYQPSPRGPYGGSKLAAEQYLLSALGKFKEPSTQNPEPLTSHLSPLTSHSSPLTSHISPLTAKHLYILRPCMIHGPGNKGNLNLLFKIVSKGIPWPLGAFENKRSFTSIENLQFIINQLIEKDIEQGIYNVADDDTLSTNSIISLIAASQGKKAKIWHISSKLISLVARIGDKLHLPLNSERLRKLTESYVVSNSKLKKALGIEKMPVGAEEGMGRTLNSFRG